VLGAIVWGADYDGRIKRLIHAFKFEGLDYLGGPLGEELADRLAPLLGAAFARPDLAVPVPLHWWRRLRRGYNQAQLLSRSISVRLDMPLSRGLLRRARHGRRQLGLSRRERQRSLADCYTVKRGRRERDGVGALRGRRILLVDDVMTTGATLEACARALLRAGATSVVGCVLARTPPPAAGAEGRRASSGGGFRSVSN
jgi:ComF family protein